MHRSVIVNDGEKISLKENWLIVKNDEKETQIPIDDIYALILDKQQLSLSVPSLNALTKAGGHIIVCDETHMPFSAVLPLTNHYRPLNSIRRQIYMSDDMKDALWDKVIESKLKNQAAVLRIRGADRERFERIIELSKEVYDGDSGNREGIGAKLYFRTLFGSDFIRLNDDGINAALNYGYAILRAAVAKTLIAYGFNCVLGIHHINESNPFNLADDMMEPLRPIVDMWVDENHIDITDALTKQHRMELINLVNELVMFDGKKMKVRNAIDRYIASFSTAIDKGDIRLLKLPAVIKSVYGDKPEDD